MPRVQPSLLSYCSYEAYVEGRQKDSLRAQGRVDQLADVDAISALDMLAEQGQWDRCLESASPHGPHVLHKYVALNTTQLIKVCVLFTPRLAHFGFYFNHCITF